MNVPCSMFSLKPLNDSMNDIYTPKTHTQALSLTNTITPEMELKFIYFLLITETYLKHRRDKRVKTRSI